MPNVAKQQVMRYCCYERLRTAIKLPSLRALDDARRAYYAVVYTPGFASAGSSAVASMSSYLADLSISERQLAAQYDSALVLLTNR